MFVEVDINNVKFTADLTSGQSLANGFGPQAENPNAFHIPAAIVEPIRVGEFVGSVKEGGSANCEVVTYCAHGNGTHTESVGHLSKERIHIPDILKRTHYTAQIITVDLHGEPARLTMESLQNISWEPCEAIIIRSLPNSDAKQSMHWSGNQPPYIEPDAMEVIKDKGFIHLLTDFPSVDPEEDAGALTAHRKWWNFPENPRVESSITEMIFVEDSIKDGLYLLEICIPKIHSDAVPSQPIVYPLNRR